jgi:hypothetical protein
MPRNLPNSYEGNRKCGRAERIQKPQKIANTKANIRQRQGQQGGGLALVTKNERMEQAEQELKH